MNVETLREKNQEFIKRMNEIDPDFFSKLQEGQKPEFFMISCSDSRVSPSVITGMPLGKMLIHRNVANQVSHDDESLATGLYYALHYLKVSYIIIIGHTGCGGIDAAWNEYEDEEMKSWLSHIQDSLPRKGDGACSSKSLATHNVLAQVENMKSHPVYLEHGHNVPVIGMVFDLTNGELQFVTSEMIKAIN
ncbi:carbonate dehydratase [Bacillus shivajii]|uniref:carbonic anhydrase n=1 Tax=Bacillus shivajii TaxID=1983719 RepID=UPI001CFAF37B|nr:carbonic anhydrase [Bacillus shivajii]UCZ53566.1 carbonate dehydratase [Bacillus shivajii]